MGDSSPLTSPRVLPTGCSPSGAGCSSVDLSQGHKPCQQTCSGMDSPQGHNLLHALLYVYSSDETFSFHPMKLCWTNRVHGLEVEICCTVGVHGVQRDNLSHHGLHHKLQGKTLCSGIFSTSSPLILH